MKRSILFVCFNLAILFTRISAAQCTNDVCVENAKQGVARDSWDVSAERARD